MGKLDGKVAVITGGNSGMGLATARLFKQEGATVIVNARNAERLEESQSLIGDAFNEILIADVGKVSDLDRFFKQIGETYKKIDVLFLNAGVAPITPLEMLTEEQFDRAFSINVKGILFGVQKARLYLSDGASIILTTSVNNKLGQGGNSVYAATKAAARSLARTLSAELVDKGIRVNAISPGPIDTPLVQKLGLPDEVLQQAIAGIEQQVAMGRWGKPEEIAQVALFFATDASSYVIGTELEVDGGMTTL